MLWTTRFVLDKERRIYHRPECEHISSVMDIIKLTDKNRKAAISLVGMTPCAYCKPGLFRVELQMRCLECGASDRYLGEEVAYARPAKVKNGPPTVVIWAKCLRCGGFTMRFTSVVGAWYREWERENSDRPRRRSGYGRRR